MKSVLTFAETELQIEYNRHSRDYLRFLAWILILHNNHNHTTQQPHLSIIWPSAQPCSLDIEYANSWKKT